MALLYIAAGINHFVRIGGMGALLRLGDGAEGASSPSTWAAPGAPGCLGHIVGRSATLTVRTLLAASQVHQPAGAALPSMVTDSGSCAPTNRTVIARSGGSKKDAAQALGIGLRSTFRYLGEKP